MDLSFNLSLCLLLLGFGLIVDSLDILSDFLNKKRFAYPQNPILWTVTDTDFRSRTECEFNPILTGHGRNQPIYERHVTTAGRNRVKQNRYWRR